jgi:hypothetical protein
MYGQRNEHEYGRVILTHDLLYELRRTWRLQNLGVDKLQEEGRGQEAARLIDDLIMDTS